jgi:hypothetical protein
VQESWVQSEFASIGFNSNLMTIFIQPFEFTVRFQLEQRVQVTSRVAADWNAVTTRDNRRHDGDFNSQMHTSGSRDVN